MESGRNQHGKGKSTAKRRESEETRKNRPQGWANNGSNKDK